MSKKELLQYFAGAFFVIAFTLGIGVQWNFVDSWLHFVNGTIPEEVIEIEEDVPVVDCECWKDSIPECICEKYGE